MSKYKQYKMSHKLRGYLGDVEAKAAMATMGGANKSATSKLKQLLPQTKQGRKLHCKYFIYSTLIWFIMWDLTFMNLNLVTSYW